jgi:hypothetical protein
MPNRGARRGQSDCCAVLCAGQGNFLESIRVNQGLRVSLPRAGKPEFVGVVESLERKRESLGLVISFARCPTIPLSTVLTTWATLSRDITCLYIDSLLTLSMTNSPFCFP